MQRALILSLAGTSGFSIMSMELLGGRILAPWFGSDIYVWGSLITVFMLSLSIGYLAGGRLSLREPSLRRYGVLFIAGALAATPLVALGDQMMEAVFSVLEDPRYGSLVAALALFTVPTIILGMISPYSVRLLVEQRERAGEVAGLLYFVSTLGSALGTLLTSFYFVLWFEVNSVLIAMSAVLLAGGALAIFAGRSRS
jgi:hypothetical protein